MAGLTTDTRTVLVLGAGVGGVVAATRLRRLLPARHRVTLIERDREQVFQPSLLWVAVGKRNPERIKRPLERLRRTGIDVVIGEIAAIDATARSVRVGENELHGDAMIIALGAELIPESVPGLSQAGFNVYAMDGAVGLRNALATFRGGRVVVLTATPAYKCPAAPYEAAMLIEATLRHHNVRGASEIALYAAEPAPMGVAGPNVSLAVKQAVEAKGIHYYPQHQVTRVDATNRRLEFANGATAEFDLLAYVPPHRAPRVVRDAALTSANGWIDVDRFTFA
ncbi:MAG: FAD/NAD(P)-binding oxidoreductase, partial [Gemmatimonadota bacterium]